MKKLYWKEFINFWLQFYSDNQGLDKKLYYPYISNNGLLKDDSLKNLWRWKMQGFFTYQRNQKALKSMEGKKDIIINFRRSKPSFNDLYDFSKKIFPNGIVYSVFLIHICKPKGYPIFDQHVFRSFNFITKKEIGKKPENKEDYLKYRNFILRIHKKYKIDLRDVDKGLMTFGQFLVGPQKFL